ncbi:hypothetical protein ADUPG1_007277, partial [Aduncisulcus paluster]
LKTLVSVDDGTGTISPSLSCSGDTISDLAGIEHLTEITHIDLSSTDISDSSHLGYLSTLSNIESLNLSDCSFASLPDLHLLASLTMLDVSSTNISLPSATATSALLPANIVEFYASSTSIGNSGFSAHIASHLSKLTKLDLSNTSVTDITDLSETQINTLTHLFLGGNGSLTGVTTTLPSMSELVWLDISGNNLTAIPDLSSCKSHLTTLNLNSNPALFFVNAIAIYGLTNLTTLNVSGCSLSDVSPLFYLSNLVTLDISSNLLCFGSDSPTELRDKFASTLSSFMYNFQSCPTECSSAVSDVSMFGANKVCVETTPASGVWSVVCSSNSYTEYSSATSFNCTTPTDSSTNCDGGCVYGEECRASSPNSTTGYCATVVPDAALHECLLSYIPTSNRADAAFSVASMHHLDGSIDCHNYSTTISSATVPVSDLTGLEHAVNISSLDLSSNSSISDVSPLSSLTSLEYLFLGSCQINTWNLTNPNGYALKTLSIPSTTLTNSQLVLSTMELFEYLSVLDISSNSSVSDISGLSAVLSTLTDVDLSHISPSVTDLTPLLPNSNGIASANSKLTS